jgi:hypothetical protein
VQDIKKWIFCPGEKCPFGKFFANDMRINEIGKLEDLKIGRLLLQVAKWQGLKVGKFSIPRDPQHCPKRHKSKTCAERSRSIVLRNFSDLEPKLDYICHPNKMGLTGFDSKCKDRARMQAGVCTALNHSYER